MKKILGFGVLIASVSTLSACGGIPSCNDELDECDRGGAYTEERTVQANKKVMVKPAPMPEPAPVVAPEPVAAPTPVVIDDTPIMTTAEPQFNQISK